MGKKPGTFEKNDPRINKAGRPPLADTLSDCIRKYLDEDWGEDGKKLTNAQRIAKAVICASLDGTPWAIQFLADRTEGKAVQKQIVEQTEPTTVIVECK